MEMLASKEREEFEQRLAEEIEKNAQASDQGKEAAASNESLMAVVEANAKARELMLDELRDKISELEGTVDKQNSEVCWIEDSILDWY